MRSLVCGWRSRSCSDTMGKAMPCGFLGMIFLASGTSALQCHNATYFWKAPLKGESVGNFEIPNRIINCSYPCMEVQLKLSIAKTVLLMTHRGCADREQKDGQGHITMGDPHFVMLYNESYCSTDLCNKKMRTRIPWSPGENTTPEKWDSIQCYAGLTLNSAVTLEGETCSKDYSRCYSGQGNVTLGPLTVPVFIKTCNLPSCIESETLSVGPMEIRQSGSCCQGSYCNGAETVVTCWFLFFSLCTISLGGALLY